MPIGPHLCYRELLPPTCIDLCTFFRCKNSEGVFQEYLFLATSSTFRIFRLIDGFVESDYLCIQYFSRIYGRPQDVCAYGQEGDNLLLISFDIAKFAVVKYVVETNTLETIRVFNAEEHGIGLGSEIRLQYNFRKIAIGNKVPIVSVDERSLVGCSLIYGSHLFIMPLPTLDADKIAWDTVLHSSSQSRKTSRYSHKQVTDSIEASGQFLIDISTKLKPLGAVLDICWVPNYGKPTVAILRESLLVPNGHTGKVRNSCVISLLAIDMLSKSSCLLWEKSNLPHDSLRIFPCGLFSPSKEISSFSSHLNSSLLVISQNALILVNSLEVHGMACNGFAKVSVHESIPIERFDRPQLGVELDSSQWIHPDIGSFIGFLKDGKVLLVRLYTSACQSQSVSFSTKLLGVCNSPSCVSLNFDSSFVFLGSRHYDGVLYKLEKGSKQLCSAEIFYTPPPKRARKSAKRVSISGVGGIGSPLNSNDASFQYYSSYFMKGFEYNLVSEFEKEEESLYGLSLKDQSLDQAFTLVDYDLRPLRNVSVVGPILSSNFSRPDFLINNDVSEIQWPEGSTSCSLRSNSNRIVSAASYISEEESKDIVMLSSGISESNKIISLFHGIRLNKLAEIAFPTVNNVCSLSFPEFSATILLLSTIDNRTILYSLFYDEKNEKGNESEFNNGKIPNMIIQEVDSEKAQFVVTEKTIWSCRFDQSGNNGDLHRQICVQVFPGGIRLLCFHNERLSSNNDRTKTKGSEMDVDTNEVWMEGLQDMLLSEQEELGGLGGHPGEYIVQADGIDDFVIVSTSLHRIYVVRYDYSEETLEILSQLESDELSIHSSLAGFSCFSGFLSFPSTSSGTGFQNSLSTNSSSLIALGSCSPRKLLRKSCGINEGELFDDLINIGSSDVDFEEKLRVLEEKMLYGEKLSTESRSDRYCVTPRKRSLDSDLIGTKGSVLQEDCDKSELLYLVLWDTSSNLYFYHIKSERIVFSSSEFRLTKDRITSLESNDSLGSSERNLFGSSSISSLNGSERKKQISFARLAWLCIENCPSQSQLCLVLSMDGGDIVVYQSRDKNGNSSLTTKSCDGKDKKCALISQFVKIPHECLSNCHSFHYRKGKNRRNPFSGVGDNGVDSDYNHGLNNFNGRIDIARDKTGQDILICSGFYGRPVAIQNCGGMPSVSYLSFPETPFQNPGISHIVPFQLESYGSYSSMTGFVSLWSEFEESMSSGSNSSLLGFYQLLGGQEVETGSSVSMKSIVSNDITIHKSLDLNIQEGLVDNHPLKSLISQQASIKQLSVLACSQEAPIAVGNALESMKDRLQSETGCFFNDLDGFFTLNSDLGGLPFLSDRRCKLALMAHGQILDEYHFPDLERIMDMSILEFPVEKLPSNVRGLINPLMGSKKRSFVIVGTITYDRHGEDNSKEGKLMVFGLDAIKVMEDKDSKDIADKLDQKNENSLVIPPENEDNNELKDQHHHNKSGKSELSSTSSSIRYRLHLISSVNGPSSILRAMGNYLVSTCGNTLHVYRFEPEKMILEPIAFYQAKVRVFYHCHEFFILISIIHPLFYTNKIFVL